MTLVKIYQSLDWRFDPSVACTVWIYLLVLWSFVLVKFSQLFLHFLCEISNCYGVKTGQYVDTGRYVKIRNFSTAECPFPIVRITNINSLFVLKCFSILGVIYFPDRVLDSCKLLGHLKFHTRSNDWDRSLSSMIKKFPLLCLQDAFSSSTFCIAWMNNCICSLFHWQYFLFFLTVFIWVTVFLRKTTVFIATSITLIVLSLTFFTFSFNRILKTHDKVFF